jgi:TonB family protein
VDPLSVPLSTVEPLAGAKRQALDHQVITGKSSPARSYYLFVAVILALILGAIFEIPRLRDSQPGTNPTAAAPSGPVATPSTSPTPARVAPETPAKPQPKVEQKQTAPRVNQPAQRSALDPAQSPQLPVQAQPPSTTSAAKQSVPKDLASSPTTSPASLKSAVPRSDESARAAPFVADREASIKAGSVTPGEALNQILPEVSEKSRSTIHGTVRTVIKVRVDSSGSVSAAEVASGGSRFFSTAALGAAKQWDFSPAKIDGHAVPSEWLLHFDFSQSDTKVTPLATKP